MSLTPTLKGRRDPEHVRSVVLRMGKPYIKALDDLCVANGRSRREVIEILVEEAAIELQADPSARLLPV